MALIQFLVVGITCIPLVFWVVTIGKVIVVIMILSRRTAERASKSVGEILEQSMVSLGLKSTTSAEILQGREVEK